MTHLSVWLVRGREHLRSLRQIFDGRTRRERLLILAVVLALGGALLDRLWLSPAFSQWSQAGARQVSASTALRQLKSDMAGKAAEAITSEKRQRDSVVLLRERVQRGQTPMHGDAFIAAADLLPVLDQLLTSSGGLQLKEMHSLAREEVKSARATAAPAVQAVPATAAATAPATATGDVAPALYRHGVEITIEGSYAALVAYLQALENMPQQMVWGGIRLKVDQHPKVSVTLRIYTLSMDREWLKL